MICAASVVSLSEGSGVGVSREWAAPTQAWGREQVGEAEAVLLLYIGCVKVYYLSFSVQVWCTFFNYSSFYMYLY